MAYKAPSNTPTAAQLLQDAKNGRKLNTRERRHCLTWLQATSSSGLNSDDIAMTSRQLAELFGVTERTIRMDKQAFRKEKAKFIREDDVSLIIADIAMDYERQVRDIEKSKAKASMGSMTYLRHCTDALELRVKMIKALQDLGYYPKNLGQLTVTKWDFQSKVDPTTGYVITEQLGAGETLPMLEGEIVPQKTLEELSTDDYERHIEANSFNTSEIEITTGPS